MFEKFTDRARKVMAFSNLEAQQMNHDYIGTEHILLGMLREGTGGAAIVLRNRGIDFSTLRIEIKNRIRSGPDMTTIGKIPQTPRAKKVVEFAITEARDAGHVWVGTEHLLLGLIREPEGIAGQVLAGFGLDIGALPSLRDELYALGKETESRGDSPLQASQVFLDEFERQRMLKIMSHALEEAQAAGLRYPHAEHVLLALFREPNSLAIRALTSVGVKEAELRAQIERLSKAPPGPSPL